MGFLRTKGLGTRVASQGYQKTRNRCRGRKKATRVHGQLVVTELNDRLMALSLEDLRRISPVIAGFNKMALRT
jgi:hypothetical protein